MSAAGGAPTGLPRPFTLGTFRKKLEEFEELIRELTLQDLESTAEERRQMIAENLHFDEFCDSIRALFGNDVRNADLKAVYRKISANPDAKVDWSELFGYFQNETDEPEVGAGEEVNVFTITARRRVGEAAGDKKRRDVIISIRYLAALDCYVTASQKGALSVYTSKFRLQACAELNESAWVTGCDYLPRLKRIATCTERSITIWDSRAKGKAKSIYFIKPIENSPQCLTWIPHPGRHHNEDVLLYGDDQGYINLVTLSPKDFNPQNAKDGNRYDTSHDIDPSRLITPIKKRRIHNDWVLRIKWFPDLQCFGSCSPSSSCSFVLEEVDRITDDGHIRSVGIPKGVNAFDYCAKANVIATGGVDKVIRVWHPHIFTRPTGKLIGHLFTIADIVCNEKDQHIISLSTARVIRIWDIHTLTSLQVFTDNDERPGEKRIYSMLFNIKHEHLLTGSSVLDVWPLTRSVQDTMQVPHTHDRPISQILYNAEVNQIITVCIESVIKVWEADTGKTVFTITEGHGPNMEVTAVCVDRSGYRMATGAVDGSLRVWDFGSGQQIKQKAGRGADDDLIINGMFYCTLGGDRCLVVQGFGNQIRVYRDSNEVTRLEQLRDFSDIYSSSVESATSRQNTAGYDSSSPLPEIGAIRAISQITGAFKKNHVLADYELTSVTYLGDICATGCSDGSVIYWNIEKSIVDRILTIPGEEAQRKSTLSRQKSRSHLLSRSLTRGQLITMENSKRINALRFLVHKVHRMDPKYLKKLRAAHARVDDSVDPVPDVTSSPGQIDTSRSNISGQSHETSQSGKQSAILDANKNNTKIDDATLDELTGVAKSTEESQPSHNADNMVPREKEVTSPAEVTEDDESTNFDDSDPDAHMLVDSFAPILVTCHSDSVIRFWNTEGQYLLEISAVTRRQGSAVTSLCTDPDCHVLVTGDSKGYVTYWDVSDFLKTPNNDVMDLVKQVLCWRAHMTRIVQLEYLPSRSVILTGSTDGSVRMWLCGTGRYVGYIGQPRPFHFPVEGDTSCTLPYDVTEGPLAPIKIVSAKTKLKAQAQRFEYPLMFDNERWRPFRRSAYTSRSHEEPTDKKFFEALIKPRPVKQNLDSSTTGEMRHGAVFRALPVYRVHTPKRLKTPVFSRGTVDMELPIGATLINTKKSRTRKSSVFLPVPLTNRSQGSLSTRRPSGMPHLTSLSVPSLRR